MTAPRHAQTAAAPTTSPSQGTPNPDQGLTVDVLVDDDADAAWAALPDVNGIISLAIAALNATPQLGLTRTEATLLLSTDAAVSQLNATYRGQHKPTNVLSFPAPRTPTPRGAPRFLGDVVVAAETLQREAETLAIPLAHHLQHLVVHGVLHLMGFDHETDDEAAIMERLETEILATIGVADPYADPVA